MEWNIFQEWKASVNELVIKILAQLSWNVAHDDAEATFTHIHMFMLIYYINISIHKY